MLDELLQYLNPEGIQYLITWIKNSLKLKFDKKNIISLTAEEYQALVDTGTVDPDVYYHVTDDYQTLVKCARYITFLSDAWEQDEDGRWIQSVDITDMTSDETLFLIPYKKDITTEEASKAYDKLYGLFVSGYGESLNGAVQYKLWSKPDTDITIGLMITDMLNTGGGGKGGSGVVVSDTEPEDPTVELWIDTSAKGTVDLVDRDEDVLTLEEIQASSPEFLAGKVPSAEAFKQLNDDMESISTYDGTHIRTDIKSYTSTNRFICPSSGYLLISSKNDGDSQVYLCNTYLSHTIKANTYAIIPVLKGMDVWLANTSTVSDAYFTKLHQ